MSNANYNNSFVSAKRLIYSIAISLWVMQAYLSNSYYVQDYGYGLVMGIKITSILLFLIELILFTKKIFLKVFVLILGVGIIITMATYSNGTLFKTSNILIVFLVLVCSKDMNFQETCKLFFWNEVIWTFIIILSAKLGIITDYISNYEGRIRDCMGSTFPGFFPVWFVNIVFCGLYSYCYDKKNIKKHWYVIILLIIGNIYLFRKTDIRLTYYITFIAIMLHLITVFLKKYIFRFNIIKYFSMLLFPICAIITFKVSYMFSWSDPIMWEINNVFSGRFQYNKQALTKYGLHLFGNVIEYNNGTMANNYSDYFFIDSGYVEIAIKYGVLFLIVLIVLNMFLIKRSFETHNNVLFIWLVVLSFYNIVNNMMFSIGTNISILAIWMFIQSASQDKIICETGSGKNDFNNNTDI